MDKDKKKTLTISSNLKKKIDTSSISSLGKKSFSVEKKIFKPNKSNNKSNLSFNNTQDLKKKTLQENLLNNKLQKILLKKITNLLVKANLD